MISNKWSPQILIPGTFNHWTERTVQMISCRIWTKKKPPNQNLNCSRLSSSLSTNVYWDRCRCLLRYMIICNATDWRNSKYCRTFSGPSFCDPNESENITPSCVCLALKNAVWKLLPHDMYCSIWRDTLHFVPFTLFLYTRHVQLFVITGPGYEMKYRINRSITRLSYSVVFFILPWY